MFSYSLSYDPYVISKYDMVAHLDAEPAILNWMSLFNGSFIIVSNLDLTKLSDILANRLYQKQFLLTMTSSYLSNGRLNQLSWKFINEPISSGRWPDNSALASLSTLLDSTKK